MGVSRSGDALFAKRQKLEVTGHSSHRQQRDRALLLHHRAAYRRGCCYSGSLRVHDKLRTQGIRTSRKRVARLMKQNGLVRRSRTRRRVTTTDSNHAHPIHPIAAHLLVWCLLLRRWPQLLTAGQRDWSDLGLELLPRKLTTAMAASRELNPQ